MVSREERFQRSEDVADAGRVREVTGEAVRPVRELVVGVVRIAGVRSEVDVQGVTPARLLAVIVPVEVNAGLVSMRSTVMG